MYFFFIVQKKTHWDDDNPKKKLNYRSIHLSKFNAFIIPLNVKKRSLQSFTFFGLHGNEPCMCEKLETCLTQFFRRWMHRCLRTGSTPLPPSPHSKYLDPRDSTYFFLKIIFFDIFIIAQWKAGEGTRIYTYKKISKRRRVLWAKRIFFQLSAPPYWSPFCIFKNQFDHWLTSTHRCYCP